MNIIANYKNRKILYNLDLEEFIEEMKNPSRSHKRLVDVARSLERDSKEYKEMKSILPCIVFNFKHKDIVRGNTITEPTGYLYLDVDNEDIDFRLYENPYVTCVWKSLSNIGYAILVKVKGLSVDNLKEVSESVARELDIPYDTRAVSKDRLHVIGYDTDIFFNPNSEVITIKNNKQLNSYLRKGTLETNINNINIGYTQMSVKMRFSNLEEIIEKIDFNGEIFIDMKEDKVEFFNVFIPSIIKVGSRNSILFSITSGIHKLNLHLSKEELKILMLNINRRSVKPPLSETEVFSIVGKVFTNKDKTLIPNNTRRILFNPDYEIGKSDKMVMRNQAIGKDRREKTDSKILNIIDNWDFESQGRITQTKVAKLIGMNSKTLNRRTWLKEYIKEQNGRVESSKKD